MKPRMISCPGHKGGLKVHNGPKTPSPLPGTIKKKGSQHWSPETQALWLLPKHILYFYPQGMLSSSGLQSSLHNISWGWLSWSWLETSITGLAQQNHSHLYNLEAR